MVVLGVTGSIGMGKSTLTRMIRDAGIPVHDSDAAVHRLMAPGGAAVEAIEQAFPGVRRADGSIDRSLLGQRVFGNGDALRRLESIVHPLVRADKAAFLARHRRSRRSMVALDVPLLYETRGERDCDAVLVVSASPFLQRQRVLARPGMTVDRLRHVLQKQMSDAEKRRRADYVIPSGLGRAVARRALWKALRDLKKPCDDL